MALTALLTMLIWASVTLISAGVIYALIAIFDKELPRDFGEVIGGVLIFQTGFAFVYLCFLVLTFLIKVFTQFS